MSRLILSILALSAAAVAQSPPTVRTVRVEPGDMVREVRLPATVLPYEEAVLISHVTGFVTEVGVRAGDWVTGSQVLLRIDVPLMAQDVARADASVIAAQARVAEEEAIVAARRAVLSRFRAAMIRSEAEQGLRRIQLERVRRLREGNAATDEEVDDAQGRMAIADGHLAEAQAAIEAAKADIRAADARVESANAELAVTRAGRERLQALARLAEIRSPFALALVVERLCDTGALVESNETPLLRVMDLERVRVHIDVDERDAVYIDHESRILLTPDAHGVPPHATTVTRFAGALDPATRTMGIEVDLDNADHAWRAGMFVHADLEVYRRPDVLSVPAQSLHIEDEHIYVFVVRAGRLERRAVQTGLDDGIQVEILSGLAAGDEVVVSGPEALAEGVEVETRE